QSFEEYSGRRSDHDRGGGVARLSRLPIKIAVARFGCKICLLAALALLGAVEARADACPTANDELATDRPDVTNSSLVVPTGSFQSENGINLSGRGAGQ